MMKGIDLIVNGLFRWTFWNKKYHSNW